MHRLIQKVALKSWSRKLNKSDDRWLMRDQPWDKLWYEIVPIKLDPSCDKSYDIMTSHANPNADSNTYSPWDIVSKAIDNKIVRELKRLSYWNSYERVTLKEREAVREPKIETLLIKLSI